MPILEPFPYQKEGARFLADRPRALLFDEPGVGKTLQAILAADMAGVQYFDAVCPASVRTQWQDGMTLGRFHNEAHSYNAARDKGLPQKMGALTLDEAHFLKGRNSGRTTKIFGDEPYGTDGHIIRAKYVWALSGTPSPKDPSDLYPLMRAVVPGSLTNRHGIVMDFWTYMKRYCNYFNGTHGVVVKGGKNLEELRDRLAPYMLRRTKKEVFKDWKEPVISEVKLDIGKAIDALRAMEKGTEGALIYKALEKDGIEGLANIADYVATLRRYTGMCKVAPTVEWICDQMDSGLDKLVIMAYHREVMDSLADQLAKRGIKTVRYQGGMTERAKDAAKRTFMEDPEMKGFLGQITAAGTGLDGLQRVTGRMLLMEYSWIPDENTQAIGRLDRYGQQEMVLAQFAGIEGSLDGAITSSMRRRAVDNKTLFG